MAYKRRGKILSASQVLFILFLHIPDNKPVNDAPILSLQLFIDGRLRSMKTMTMVAIVKANANVVSACIDFTSWVTEIE